MKVSQVLKNINPRSFTNNTQRVARRLLRSSGQWVRASDLRVPSATSRLRDLRTTEFGNLDVQIARNENGTYLYRVLPSTVTKTQLSTIFGI